MRQKMYQKNVENKFDNFILNLENYERRHKYDWKQQLISGNFNHKNGCLYMLKYLAYQINQRHSPTHLYSMYKCAKQESISERITILSSSQGIVSKITCKREDVEHK